MDIAPADIAPADLDRSDVVAFLQAHLDEMHANTPEGHVHALDRAGLGRPELTLWTLREDGGLLACGALKQLDPSHAEIKSMRVAPEARGRGLGTRMLRHLLDEARARGCARVSLETGAGHRFAAALGLYRSHGFVDCGAFGGYPDDPHSAFLTLAL